MVNTSASFPGYCLVSVNGKGPLPLEFVRLGDQVEAYDLRRKMLCWSPVTSFAMRDPTKAGAFRLLGYKFSLGGGVSEIGSITMGNDALVYLVERGEMTPASMVVAGQHMLLCRDGHTLAAEITGSTVMQGQGVYTPVTRHGTIVVDGVVASCRVGRRKFREMLHSKSRGTPIAHACMIAKAGPTVIPTEVVMPPPVVMEETVFAAEPPIQYYYEEPTAGVVYEQVPMTSGVMYEQMPIATGAVYEQLPMTATNYVYEERSPQELLQEVDLVLPSPIPTVLPSDTEFFASPASTVVVPSLGRNDVFASPASTVVAPSLTRSEVFATPASTVVATSIPRREALSIPRSEAASIARSEDSSIPSGEPFSFDIPPVPRESLSIPRSEESSIPRRSSSIPRSETTSVIPTRESLSSIPRSEASSVPRSEALSIPRSEAPSLASTVLANTLD